MQTEIHFRFNDTEDLNYHIVTNARKYYDTLKDLDGWIGKTIKNSEYNTQDFDKETLEYVRSKLHEIAMNYQITI